MPCLFRLFAFLFATVVFPATVLANECNPIIEVKANQQSRFELLKKLADEHQFEISMLKTDDKAISLEKTLPLTKAIESITRDMSVVLRYQRVDGCERIVAINALDEEGWESSSGGGWGRNPELKEKLQRYIPKFQPPRVLQAHEVEQPEQTYEQQQANEQRSQEHRERRGMRRLNDELEGGHQLRNNFNVRGDGWKTDLNSRRGGHANIPDMEQYAREVMDGEREADIRSMSIQQRSEYMKMRRQLRSEDRDED